MANALNPVVNGIIRVNFSPKALVEKTREERNEYLKVLRDRLGSVLDTFMYQLDILDGWFIELHDDEKD